MMENRTDRITAIIRRDEVTFRVGVSSTLDEGSRGWDEGDHLDWVKLGQASESILNTVAEINLRHNDEAASSRLVDLGRRLFDCAFPGAIGQKIRSSSANFLVFDLTADVVSIPWELAHDGTDFLGCRFATGRLVQGWEPAVRTNRPRLDSKFTILLVSDPTGDLPEAAREGEFLSDRLSVDLDQEVVWLNGRVDRQSLQHWFPKADLLHYCGHFTEWAVGGDGPGWELTGARFTPLDLKGECGTGTGAPLLVFNNACHSLETSPPTWAEHESPFAASFLKSGCLHYIGACSKVIDRCGAEFARIFYQRLLTGGTLGMALRLARLETRSKGESDNLTWAQYMLYGDPTTGVFGATDTSVETQTVMFAVTPGENALTQEDSRRIRDLLTAFPNAQFARLDQENMGVIFSRPSDAVRFSLLLRARNKKDRNTAWSDPRGGLCIGIASGEVFVERGEGNSNPFGVRGRPAQIAQRLAALAAPGQTLLSRAEFDISRAVQGGKVMNEVGEIAWFDHGAYLFPEIESPVGVCEVGEKGFAPLIAPGDSELARRFVPSDQEPVPGWRPALGLEIPTSPRWVLIAKLGEGGFGEVWRAEHKHSGSTRVFKFCFKADRVRSLKREATLFRVLKESIGAHPGIVQVLNTYFEEPPFYIEMEDVPGENLAEWWKSQGGADGVPIEVRLEIVAQTAEALQVAHDSGVIHRDIKPSNILVVGSADDPKGLRVKLSDFGIGQVQEKSRLGEITASGFTETFSATELSSGSGTRLYMAPELLVGKPSSTRSDGFSLGVVLYQLLVGDLGRPLASDWREEVRDPLLIEDLERLLSGDPGKRLPAIGDLAERLRSIERRRAERDENLASERKRTRKRRMIQTLSAVAVVFFLTTLALMTGLMRERRARMEYERELYFSTIALADDAVQSGEIAAAQNLLYRCPPAFRNWEWGRLLYLCNLDVMALSGHVSRIQVMAQSWEGTLLATSGSQGTVCLWDLQKGICLASLKSENGFGSLAFGFEDRVLIGSYHAGFEIYSIVKPLSSPPATSKGLASSPSQEWILELQKTVSIDMDGGGEVAANPVRNLFARYQNSDRTIVLWDLESGAALRGIQAHSLPLKDLSFSPDGTRLASVSDDKTVRLWDIDTGSELWTSLQSAPSLWSVSFSPDGKRLAVGSRDGLVYLIDSATGELVDKFETHVGGIRSIDYSSSGELLAVGGKGRSRVRDLKAAKWIQDVSGTEETARGFRFAPDDKSLVAAHEDHTLKIWPLGTDRGMIRLAGHVGHIRSLSFSPDHETFLTAGEDFTASLWDARTGEERKTLVGHYHEVMTAVFAPDGQGVLTGGHDNSIRIWDTSTGSETQTNFGHSDSVFDLAFSPKKDLIASAANDGTVRLWSYPDLLPRGLFQDGRKSFDCVAFSEDGETFFAGGPNSPPKEVSVDSLHEVSILTGQAANLNKLVLSPDWKRLAATGWSPQVMICELTGEASQSFQGLGAATSVNMFFAPAFDPASSRIVAAGEQGPAIVWDLATCREVLTLPSLGGHCAWSHDGRLIAAMSAADDEVALILPAFPWKAEDYPGDPSQPFEERLELYKRAYWKERLAPLLEAQSKPRPTQGDGITGQWDFDQGDLAATIGRDMSYLNYAEGADTGSKTRFGTTTEFGIPDIQGVSARVMKFPACERNEGYRVFTGALPDDGRFSLQRYSVVLDVLYPSASSNKTRLLFHVRSHNTTDKGVKLSAENGIGIDDQYDGNIPPNEWRRLALVYELDRPGGGRLRKFIDGVFVGEQMIKLGAEGRHAAPEGTRGRSMSFFTDDDGEVAEGYVNSIQFRNYAMTDEEVAALGAAAVEGIPIDPPQQGSGGSEILGSLDSQESFPR